MYIIDPLYVSWHIRPHFHAMTGSPFGDLYRLARTSESSSWTQCGECEESSIASLVKSSKPGAAARFLTSLQFWGAQQTAPPLVMQTTVAA